MTRRVNTGEQSDVPEKLVSSDAAGGHRVFLPRHFPLQPLCSVTLLSSFVYIQRARPVAVFQEHFSSCIQTSRSISRLFQLYVGFVSASFHRETVVAFV